MIGSEKSWKEAWAAFVPARGAGLALVGTADVPEERLSEELTAAQKRELAGIPHAFRRAEWAAARIAEWRAGAGARVGQPGDALSSVSHTRDGDGKGAWAVAIGCGPGVARIGVDLEASARAVSERLLRRLLLSSEREVFSKGGLSGLDLWVLKEAAFKATPGNESELLSGIELKSFDPEAREGEARSARLEAQGLSCRVKLLTSSGWKLAFAYSARGPGFGRGPGSGKRRG